MPGRLGPRFAIEALFLIALAVGAAYADLANKWIVLVMAGGWLVVALLELAADRIWAAAPPWRRPYYVPVPPPRAEAATTPPPAEEVAAAEPAPEPEPAAPEPAAAPEPEPEPVAEVAAPEPAPKPEPAAPEPAAAPEEPEPVAEVAAPEPAPEPEPEAVTVIVPREEPSPGAATHERAAEEGLPLEETIEPMPKRRWFRRRQREDTLELIPEPELPKHVRLLPPSEHKEPASDEVSELFETSEPEEEQSRG
jgi:hypothetical protein